MGIMDNIIFLQEWINTHIRKQYTGMKLNGNFDVTSSRKDAAAKILSAENLLTYIPDIVDSQIVNPKEIEATIKAGIAFIKGKFKTRILISADSNEENVKISGNGTGSNSSLAFTVNIMFDESGTGCTISYDADVGVAGNAATMGQRVIEKAARDYVEKIIGNYKKSFR